MTPQTPTSSTVETTRPREIEAVLLRDPSIADCAVRLKAIDGLEIAVAFVVAPARFDAAEIREHVRKEVHEAPALEFVRVSSLPFTQAGEIDDAVLDTLPVLTESVARSWEDELSRLPGVAKAAVVVQEPATPVPVLHLSDLVPDALRSRNDSASALSSGSASTEGNAALRVPSLVRGPALRADPNRPATLVASIDRAAREFPAAWLRFLETDGSEVQQSYAELLDEARRILGGLRQMGLRPQDKVLFQLEHVKDFVAAFWGCVLGGFVPVPITIASAYKADDSAASKLFNAWKMFNAPLVLTSARRRSPIESLFKELGAPEARVAGIDELRQAPADLNPHPCAPHDLALIMLTSGSTGAPKGVMLSHDNMLRMAAGVQQQLNLTEAEVTLNWMPMDHVAGLVMSHQRDVLIGCSQVHLPTEIVLQRPVTWLDLIDRFRVTLSFAPNFAFGLVNQCAEQIAQGQWDLSSLRVILNAGEMIVARTTRRFLTLLAPHKLPPTAMVPVWGMSETSSGIIQSIYFTVANTSDEDSFVDVGEPVADFNLRIVDEAGQIVEQGTIGQLQVSGTTVTRGYYERPDLDAEAFTVDGWFKTGDLAVIRNDQLAITGRAKDDININGIKYFCHEIESVAESVPGVQVSFTAACAVRRPGADSEDVVVFFVPATGADEAHLNAVISEVRRAVVTRIGIAPSYVIPVTRPDIPKTNLGKIQRAHIRKRFEAGEFSAEVKRQDVLARNANTLPDWFLKQTWRRANLAAVPVREDEACTLVFSDERLGPPLIERLEKHRPAIVVQPGASFARRSASRYEIRLSEAEDYEQLIASIRGDGRRLGNVVHVMGFGPPATSVNAERDRSSLSVLFLARSLASIAAESTMRLVVASSRAQHLETETEVEPERGAVLGLLQTIVQEMPGIDTRHVDVTENDPSASADAIVNELRALGQEREVAYRQGVRYVSRFERLGLPGAAQHDLPFKSGGMYVLTGGLGGVGVEIGKFLLQRYGVRLLVLGRTPVTEGTSPQELERRQSYETLSAAVADHAAVRYEAVDVTDAARVRTAVQAASQEWGCSLDGVIHLAGVFRDRLLLEETPASFHETCLPKLDGSAALAGLLDRGDQLFIAFSSATGYFGRFSGGGYAAASRGLDALVQNIRRRGVNAYSFAWSEWEDLGMMRGWGATQSRSRGYASMSKAQGISSLMTALRQKSPVVLIGIDADAAPIRPHVTSECRGLSRLVAFVQTINDAQVDVTRPFADRFGSKLACDVERVSTIPLRATGDIDRDALVSGTVKTARRKTAPTTDLERTIAHAWEHVLGVTEVDVKSTFFDVGGSSLLMARVYARLKDALPQSASMTDMFRYPTISALAAHLSENESTFDNQIAIDRERGRDRRARILQTRRGRENDDAQGSRAR